MENTKKMESFRVADLSEQICLLMRKFDQIRSNAERLEQSKHEVRERFTQLQLIVNQVRNNEIVRMFRDLVSKFFSELEFFDFDMISVFSCELIILMITIDHFYLYFRDPCTRI